MEKVQQVHLESAFHHGGQRHPAHACLFVCVFFVQRGSWQSPHGTGRADLPGPSPSVPRRWKRFRVLAKRSTDGARSKGLPEELLHDGDLQSNRERGDFAQTGIGETPVLLSKEPTLSVGTRDPQQRTACRLAMQVSATVLQLCEETVDIC